MGVQYTNRRGDTYHLQATTDKKGKVRYSFTRKPKGTPVDALPEGYEIYEAPDNAQVHLRKALQTKILPIEKQLLAALIQKAGVEHYIIDVEESALVVYLSDTDEKYMDSLLELRGFMNLARAQARKDEYIRSSRYTAMMRFVLVDDSNPRHFACQRWCFRGGIDCWISLMTPNGLLTDVAARHVPHLGKQSFYDLM